MSKRYYDIDMARCFFILTLPMIHVYEYLGSWGGMAGLLTEGTESVFAPIVCFLTVFGAPTFTVCMGMNIVFSRNAAPEKLKRRGIQLLFVELCFNLLRYVLPGLIGVSIGGTDTADASTVLFWMVYGLINSDILAFSGMAFMVFSLFIKRKFSGTKVAIAGILCFAINELLARFVSPIIDGNCNYFFSELLGNLFYVNGDSTFPLLSWLVFPCFGYFFAEKFVNKDSEKPWHGMGGIAAICLIAAIILANGSDGSIMSRLNATELSNRLDPLCALGEVSASFVFIYICHILFGALGLDKNERVKAGMMKYSSCITYNYLVQWTIIGWALFISGGIHLWNSQSMGIAVTIVCIVVITAFSYVFGRFLQKKDKSFGIIP